ncbi:glycosyltransferase family 4 protein [Methylophaga thalassica]|uniref:glycosyltransferase family 4 protein n=1 Tax=Methylophaga aminisulfidivorans TaxID=230105 RepID=UPI003A8E79A4
MKYAVCLYKYFPFGGLARDFMNIMRCCLQADDTVDVYVMEWQGEVPKPFNVQIIETHGWSNHARLQSYIDQVLPQLHQGAYDLVIGFNKMPGLDVYYAADPCYIDRIRSHPMHGLLQFSGRVKFYKACEEAVFGKQSNTVSMMISDVQQTLFEHHYGTPKDRLVSLPPGIDRDRKRPQNAELIRQQVRDEFNVSADEWLLLMVGTGFKTKGVDRAIAALANLPDAIKQQTKLMIIGDGDNRYLQRQAQQSGIDKQVAFLGGRSDIPRFLLAADLLIHPARKENTGTVILEAMVAGLPSLVSDVCGYTKHVIKADAGLVIKDADSAQQTALDLVEMLDKDKLQQWSQHALHYAATEDLYSMPQQAAAVIRSQAKQKRKKQ